MKPGYGEHESNERKLAVRWTQRGIKHVLTERHYAWEEARQLAQQDQEVDLSGEGAAYQPGRMLEDEVRSLYPVIDG